MPSICWTSSGCAASGNFQGALVREWVWKRHTLSSQYYGYSFDHLDAFRRVISLPWGPPDHTLRTAIWTILKLLFDWLTDWLNEWTNEWMALITMCQFSNWAFCCHPGLLSISLSTLLRWPFHCTRCRLQGQAPFGSMTLMVSRSGPAYLLDDFFLFSLPQAPRSPPVVHNLYSCCSQCLEYLCAPLPPPL